MSIGAVGMTGSLVLGGSQKWSKAGHGDAVGAFRVAGQQGARGLGLRHVVTWLRGKEVHSPPCPDPHSLAELRPVEGLRYLYKPCSWVKLACSAPQRSVGLSVCLSVRPSLPSSRPGPKDAWGAHAAPVPLFRAIRGVQRQDTPHSSTSAEVGQKL